MEPTAPKNTCNTTPKWEHITVLRSWKGLNLTISYPNYLSTWWLKNKTEQFTKVMEHSSSTPTQDLQSDFYQTFEELPLELQDLLESLFTFNEVLYHKSLFVEKRGFIKVLVQKNALNVKIDFFSKNFLYEKILLKHFYHTETTTDYFSSLKKAQDLLKRPNSVSELEYITKKEKLPDLLNSYYSPVSDVQVSTELALRSKAYATTLLVHIGKYRKSSFEKFSDFGLSLVSEYEALRLHLLKFLAILPCLDHDQKGHEVKRLFLESLDLLQNEKQKNSSALPLIVKLFLPVGQVISRILPAYLLASFLRFSSAMMAKRFIAGESIKKSLPTLAALNQTGRDATLDQLGELVLCEEEADHYKNKVLEIISGLEKFYPDGQRNEAGILRAHVSIKTTALGSQLKAHAFEDSYHKIAPRLKELLLAAKKAKVFVNIDAEHYHFRDLVWRIYSRVLKENKELYFWQDTGIVVQAYLTDASKHLKEICDFQSERKVNMPIRLVKGAYWDAETIEAQAHHFDPPQFLNKIETDIHFRQLAHELLANNYVQLVIASHNVLDHCYVEALRTTFFPRSTVIEHQCLHMTYEALSVSLVQMGYVVRNYMPVGNLLVGMAYLVRRIMENSSQVGVLKMSRSHQSLDTNQNIHTDWLEAKKSWKNSDGTSYHENTFENAAPVRLYLDGQWNHYEQIRKSLQNFTISITQTAPLAVAGTLQEIHQSWARESWREDILQRTFKLLQVAEWFTIFRDEISIVITKEAHKSVLEAYADVDEAIDFITYYVDQFLENPNHGKMQALGVVAAITPWNFPFAIPAGMVIAPLMAGNAVVLKSAEQTPQVAQVFVNFVHCSGVPKEIFQHLVGAGETVGAAITQSQDLHGLVFTGSAVVGTMLYKNLSGHSVSNLLGQKFIRPVITEMGGKNPIIVTQNAELDETISGILYSAFAHAGQKCSACSRVIVDNKILPVFKKRLLASIASIKTGVATDPAVVINPVISIEDKKRLIEYKRKAVEEALSVGGQVLLDLQENIHEGNSIGPLVIELPLERAKHFDSYSQKEAFGPIIHLIGYSTLEEALLVANATNYALTAGLYAQSPKDIDYFSKTIESGNIYINRPNTGARVGIEPFGGFKMSGTGPKAGSRNYIFSFMHDNCHHNLASHSSTKYDLLDLEKTIYPLPILDNKFNENFVDLPLRKILEVLRAELVQPSFIIKNEEKLEWDNHAHYLLAQPDDLLHYDNVHCPGQKSFSNWDLRKKLGLFWQDREELSFKDILFITYFLRRMVPMIVVVQSSESKKFWRSLIAKLEFNHYPKNLIVLWEAADAKIFKEIHQLTTLEILHLAVGSVERYHDVLRQLIQTFSYKKCLPQVLSSFSSVYSALPQVIENNFAHERSYAINVMRHGAPLENE